MIDKAILKKHNLKAVPFSSIGEGQTFNMDSDFYPLHMLNFFKRKLCGDQIAYADGFIPCLPMDAITREDETVYVPVWRPC